MSQMKKNEHALDALRESIERSCYLPLALTESMRNMANATAAFSIPITQAMNTAMKCIQLDRTITEVFAQSLSIPSEAMKSAMAFENNLKAIDLLNISKTYQDSLKLNVAALESFRSTTESLANFGLDKSVRAYLTSLENPILRSMKSSWPEGNLNVFEVSAIQAKEQSLKNQPKPAHSVVVTTTEIQEQEEKMPVTYEATPAYAEKFLYFILEKKQRESLPGDLEEEYRTVILPKLGKKAADAWYWKQVVDSAIPIIQSRFISLLKLAWLGKVASWIFSKFGT